MRMTMGFLPVLITLIFGSHRSAFADNAPFPQPASDQTKVTVPFVAAAGDAGLVEVVIGRVESTTDTCNSISIVGDKLIKKTIEGWGFDYYVFERTSDEGEMSTRMACPNRQKVDRFIPARIDAADGLNVALGHLFIHNFLDGNVFYLPRGFSLKYRAWTANGEFVPGKIDMRKLK